MASGGLGVSNEEGKSGGQNQFNQRIWKPQGKALKELWGNLPGLFDQFMGSYNKNAPWATNYMKDAANKAGGTWQDMLQGGVYKDMGLAKKLGNSLDQSLSSPTNTQSIYSSIMGGQGNNYADAMKESYLSDSKKAMDQMLSTLDTRAAFNGQSGGARHGVAQGLGMRDINQNLQQNLAKTGYETFDKDLMNKLNIAQQADQSTLSRQGMLQNMLNAMQGNMSGAVSNTGAMQNLANNPFSVGMMPWQAAGSWSNILGNPTTLSSGSGSNFGESKGTGVAAEGSWGK